MGSRCLRPMTSRPSAMCDPGWRDHPRRRRLRGGPARLERDDRPAAARVVEAAGPATSPRRSPSPGRGVPLAVRGGGHNVAGNGTVDGGIVLDLGRLDGRRGRPERPRGPGRAPARRLADVDRATEPYGLAVPIGVVSGTGVAGLTLGGGVGWLTRPTGCRSTTSRRGAGHRGRRRVRGERDRGARAVLGRSRRGRQLRRRDVVHVPRPPARPGRFAGTFVYRADRWADALAGLGVVGARRRAGRADLDRHVHDAAARVRARRRAGHAPGLDLGGLGSRRGRAVVETLRQAAPPDAMVIQPIAWTAWQSAADSLFPKGVRAYWKNTSFERWTTRRSTSSSAGRPSRRGRDRRSTSTTWRVPSDVCRRTRHRSPTASAATG